MHDNQNSDKNIHHLLPPRPPGNRRLDRPGDLKVMEFLSAYPNNNFELVNGTMMIPIPPEDAKALGLRIPGSKEFSIGSASQCSGSSASTSKSTGKRHSIDDDKSHRDAKRHRNVDIKATKKLANLKKEQKSQRTAASEKLSNFHAKLERGLRSISNRTRARRKVNPETSDVSPAAFSGINNSPTSSSSRKNSLSCQEKLYKLGKESSSKSMKQLFSMAGSWSNDSVVSHSDSCACCHGREPCPFHDNNAVD